MEKVVKIFAQGERRSDYHYWRDKSFAERIDAMEGLRRQYMEMTGHVGERLQRICRVIKPT